MRIDIITFGASPEQPSAALIVCGGSFAIARGLAHLSEIEQLTIDHSIAQALVEARTISAAEARVHRYRNVLWKYLGSREVGEGPEIKALTAQVGDRILLCTDGLSGVVSDEKLQSFILEHPDVSDCADGLGQLALDSGSRDNVSCIVIEVIETK